VIKILTDDELGFQLFLALKKFRNPSVPEELLRRIWDNPTFQLGHEKAECLAQARHLLSLITTPAPVGHVCDDDCPQHGWRAP
jgi:hypothetical protein